MEGKTDTYRYKGHTLDLWLTYRFDRSGLYLLIQAKDKQGRLVEGKEFTFDERVVRAWFNEVVRRNLRSLFTRH